MTTDKFLIIALTRHVVFVVGHFYFVANKYKYKRMWKKYKYLVSYVLLMFCISLQKAY